MPRILVKRNWKIRIMMPHSCASIPFIWPVIAKQQNNESVWHRQQRTASVAQIMRERWNLRYLDKMYYYCLRCSLKQKAKLTIFQFSIHLFTDGNPMRATLSHAGAFCVQSSAKMANIHETRMRTGILSVVLERSGMQQHCLEMTNDSQHITFHMRKRQILHGRLLYTA